MNLDIIAEITVEAKGWKFSRIKDYFGEGIFLEKDNQEQGINDAFTLRTNGNVMHTGMIRGIETKHFLDIDKAVEYIKEVVYWIEEGAEKGFFVGDEK